MWISDTDSRNTRILSQASPGIFLKKQKSAEDLFSADSVFMLVENARKTSFEG
jgi:hypothetical protein